MGIPHCDLRRFIDSRNASTLRLVLIALSFLSCVFVVSGQNLKFEIVPTELGLSQNFVSDIVEDSTGFLWMATPSGLNRFDGYGYEIFKNDPDDSLSVGSDNVHRVIIDKRGALWVGHEKGLQVYDIHTNHFVSVPLGYETPVRHLVNGNENDVWLIDGLRTIHQVRYTENGEFEVESYPEVLPSSHTADDLVRSILVDANDRLWINAGSDMAMLRFDGSRPELQFVDWDSFKQKEKPALSEALHRDQFGGDQLAQAMFKDKSGLIYIYDEWVLSIVSGDEVSSVDVRSLENGDQVSHGKPRYKGFVDDSGILWIYTILEGSHMAIDLKRGRVLDGNKAIFENITAGIMCITQARNGVFWLGTNGNGIYKATPHKQIFNSPPVSQNIATRTAYPIYKDDEGHIWFGDLTDVMVIPKGASRPQKINFSLANYGHTRRNPETFRFAPKFIKGDGRGGIWLGNYDGLHRMKKKGAEFTDHRFYPINTHRDEGGNGYLLGVYDLITDAEGQIWVVTAGEFGKFDPSTGYFEAHTFADDFNTYSDRSVTNRIVQSDETTFWIGTRNGLIRFDSVKEKFTFYLHDSENDNSLSTNIIKSLILDPRDRSVIWIGTDGEGLERFDTKTGEFRHFTVEDGLPDETVYGILSNGERELWLSTNKGICSFDIANETFQSYSASDGLQDNEFNTRSYCKASDGELLFGGIYGINRFYPDQLFESDYHPATAITAVKINNEAVRFNPESEVLTQPIESAREITLTPNVKMVSFSIAGMDLTFPEKTAYRYKLENFDDRWNAIGRERAITFTSLPYGDYTLMVQSTNRSGMWSPKTRELSMRVPAPWWRTGWAYSLYAILIIAAVVFIYLFQLRRANEKREAQRIMELDGMKSRLFTNITHEFRTPITVISGMASMIEDQPEYTQTIRKNADNLMQMVNQILDLSKLEANKLEIRYSYGNVVEYIKYLTESLSGTALQQGKELVVHSSEAEINMDYDEMKIRHIIYNLLSNALKFTEEGDRIEVNISEKDSELRVEVKDTGIGIPADKLPHIFNRFYQVDDSSTRTAQGTGIGLSLCYELIKLLDGQMTVESKEGEGSTFGFSLPIKTEYAQGDYEPFHRTVFEEPAPEQALVSEGEAEKPLLLLVEDNYEIVRFIELLLDGAYSIVHAENGQRGIDEAISKIPDIIISDVMMPIKNGYELTETLKNDIRTSHIPIILLTAKSTQADRNIGLEKGADAYLHKPFDKGELQIRLRKLIELRQLLISKFKGLEESDEKGDELENRFLNQVRRIILENLDNSELKVEDLENAMKLSKMQLYRKLKALTGMSPTLVVRDLRLSEAAKLIRKGELNVSEVAYQVGFSDPSYFTRAFKEKFDAAPSQYK